MNKIFQKRLKDFVLRVDQAIKTTPVEGATNTKELINLLHSKRSNIILFPGAELSSMSEAPCPGSFSLQVKSTVGKDNQALIHTFKRLRDYLDIRESTACGRCPQSATCSLKLKIPNSKYEAGVRDVFQALLAYGSMAERLDSEMEHCGDLASQILEEKQATEEQTAAVRLQALYGLKMTDAVVVLQALETLVEDKLEGGLLQEKFGAALAEFEHDSSLERGLENPRTKKNGEMDNRGNRQSKEISKNQYEIQQTKDLEYEARLRNSFPGKLPEGKLTEKQRTYLKKFDEHVSTKPIPDTGSRQLPKKKVKGGELYVDSVKKQVQTTVAGQFLKDYQKQGHISPRERREKTNHYMQNTKWEEDEDGLSRVKGKSYTNQDKPSANQPREGRYHRDRPNSGPIRENMYGERNQSRDGFESSRNEFRTKSSNYSVQREDNFNNTRPEHKKPTGQGRSGRFGRK